jgi:ferrochelatase
MNEQLGILLINVGTPDAPTEDAVRVYLQEFLNDPLVVDYPRWLWKPLLEGIILKVRPPKSARLYQKIWQNSESPILTYMQSISEKLGQLHRDWQVAIGMRYGNPSLQIGLEELHLKGVRELVIFPLFPQYSTTTSLSAIQATQELVGEFNFHSIRVIENYHDHPAYIEALSESIQTARNQFGNPEKTLLSFHSIPRRYVTNKKDPYLSHCQTTARLVNQGTESEKNQMEVVFQSRFGPEPWLSPYLSDRLTSLGESGCQSLQVICPGFAADCLETLEEVAVDGRDLFQEAGGGDFHYIPALNDSENHLQALSAIIKDFLKNQ